MSTNTRRKTCECSGGLDISIAWTKCDFLSSTHFFLVFSVLGPDGVDARVERTTFKICKTLFDKGKTWLLIYI